MFKNTITTNSQQTYFKHTKVDTKDESQIYHAQNKDNKEFILKEFEIPDSSKNNEIGKALNMIQNIDHPQILKLADYVIKKNKLFLLFERQNTEIFTSYLENNKKGLDSKEVIQFLRQIAESFKIMQKYKIAHGNLSLNSLLFNKSNIYVCDFGLQSLKILQSEDFSILSQNSPEKLQKGIVKPNTDVWNIGMVTYMMLFGKGPFDKAKSMVELMQMQKEQSGQNLHLPKKVSFELQNLLKRAIVYSYKERMTFEELFQHPAVQISDGNQADDLVQDYFNHSADQKKIQYQQNKEKISTDFGKLVLSHSKKLPIIDTNVSDAKLQNAKSITTQNSVFTELENSHSSLFESNPDMTESNFPEDLSFYLYQKNVIIFIIDTLKKLKECESNGNLKKIDSKILWAELLIIQKMINFNNHILQKMKNKNNLFELDDFDSIVQSKQYHYLIKLFSQFEEVASRFYRETFFQYCQVKTDQDKEFNNNNCQNDYIIEEAKETSKTMFEFFQKNKKNLKEEEKNFLIQALIYIFFNDNIFQKFPYERFTTSEEWSNFCQYINQKDWQTLEKKLTIYLKQLHYILNQS